MTNVCVIDDDDAIRLAVRTILEDAGYHVAEEADAVAGYYLLLRCPAPRVVLLDLKLPAFWGDELLELALYDPHLRRHRYVFFTALRPSERAERYDALLGRIDAAIVDKPFEIDELLAVVRERASQLPCNRAQPAE